MSKFLVKAIAAALLSAGASFGVFAGVASAAGAAEPAQATHIVPAGTHWDGTRTWCGTSDANTRWRSTRGTREASAVVTTSNGRFFVRGWA